MQEQIAASDGQNIHRYSCHARNHLLAIHTSEKNCIGRWKYIKGTDTPDRFPMQWQPCNNTVQKKDKKNDLADVIVYTDGIGAKQTKNLKSQLQVTGWSSRLNVANTFLSCTKDSRGHVYEFYQAWQNHSDHAANMEITLYEGRNS